MALALDTIQTWLAEQGITVPVLANWLPDDPDECVVLGAGGGSPPSCDGLFEGTRAHIRCRAATDAGAEALARQVHGILSPMTLGGSFTMGSARVRTVEPSAPPAYLMRDLKERTIYYASYLVTVAVP